MSRRVTYTRSMSARLEGEYLNESTTNPALAPSNNPHVTRADLPIRRYVPLLRTRISPTPPRSWSRSTPFATSSHEIRRVPRASDPWTGLRRRRAQGALTEFRSVRRNRRGSVPGDRERVLHGGGRERTCRRVRRSDGSGGERGGKGRVDDERADDAAGEELARFFLRSFGPASHCSMRAMRYPGTDSDEFKAHAGELRDVSFRAGKRGLTPPPPRRSKVATG